MALTEIDWGDGFTGIATADLAARYTNVHASATIVAGEGRLGNPAAKLASGQFIAKGIPAPRTTINVAFAIKLDAAPTASERILSLESSGGTVQDQLFLHPNGSLQVYRGGTVALGSPSTPIVTVGPHFHFELQLSVSDTVGTAILRLAGNAGSPLLNQSGLDTRNGTPTDISTVVIYGCPNGSGKSTFFSDWVIGNDWIGNYHFTRAKPDGAGNYSQFTPSAGSNFQCVDDDSPDGDTTKVSSSTLNHIDTYTMEAAPAGASILAVLQNIVAKASDTGPRELKPVRRIGGVDYLMSQIILGTSYQHFQERMLVSPATAAAWGESEYNGGEAGVKVTV